MMFLKQNRAFGELAVAEVFAYFDGPRLFVAKNAAGQGFLVNSLDSDARTETWLLTAISELRLLQLTESIMDIRTAFLKPELNVLYEVTSNLSQELLGANPLSPSDLTDDWLPEPKVFLAAKPAREAPNAAFLAKSLDAVVVLLHLFPNQTRYEAPLKGVGKIFASLQDYLELKLSRAIEAVNNKNVFRVELLGTFAGSLGIEIAVRGEDSRIAPTLKAAVATFALEHELREFSDRMALVDPDEASAVKRFMQSLTAVRSGLEIEVASQVDEEATRVAIDLPLVREAIKTIGVSRSVRKETRTVVGDLVGLNLRTYRFELVSLETEEAVTGTLATPMFSEQQTAELPRRYRVVVERELKLSSSGREVAGAWKMISATKLM